ncbi:MAG: histidine kinase [Bacillota bacterium]|nr:histidine kinase [Bacillota bacterium]
MVKKNRNFKESIRYFFLKYAVIPVIIAFALFSIFMIAVLRINTINKTNQASYNISSSMGQVYKNYSDEIERTSKSPAVINLINTRLHSNQVYDEFYKFNNNQKVKSIFYVIDKNDVFLVYTAASDADIGRSIIRNSIYRIEENPDLTIAQTDVVNYPNGRKTVYTFAKAVKDKTGIIGYVIYQLYEEDIQKLIRVSDNEIAVITDEYNSVIVTNNNSVVGLMNKFNPKYYYKDKYVELETGKYYINREEVPNASIYVYTLNSIQIKSLIFILYFIFLIIVSIGLMLLMNHLANRMSSRNTESIDKLIHSVNQLQNGKMDSYVDIKSGDEFEVLANQYNIMLDELNGLITKNEELSNLRRITEIKQLQSQFNPHFIFNILGTLRYSILIAPKEAEKIVIGLSSLLRYSINYEGQKVVLEKDLDYIQDYLRLNKYRFNDRLEYSINMPENIKKAYVPKLFLQAVIENSIKYGYIHKDKLKISAEGHLDGGVLTLEVRDNGNGMTFDQLQNIREIINQPENLSEHTGLYNVHRRIVLLYGEEYGIQIESTLGVGTNVKITIPYEEGDTDV